MSHGQGFKALHRSSVRCLFTAHHLPAYRRLAVTHPLRLLYREHAMTFILSSTPRFLPYRFWIFSRPGSRLRVDDEELDTPIPDSLLGIHNAYVYMAAHSLDRSGVRRSCGTCVTYGASPRNLINFAHELSVHAGMVNEEMNELLPQDFTKLLHNADKAADSSHSLVSTEPPSTNRTSPERKIVSTYVPE